MITLPHDIDRGAHPRSPTDVRDERVAIDAALTEASKPGLFATEEKLLAVSLVTDDAGLEFQGRALAAVVPRVDGDDEVLLASTTQILTANLVMEAEVSLMIALTGPKSPAERVEVPIEAWDGPVPGPAETFSAIHRRISGPRAAAVFMAEQLAAALEARWGLTAHHFPRASLAAMLNAERVVTGAVEIAGRPLWQDKILLAKDLPVGKRSRWNGEIRGATVDRGWWTTVRRRTTGQKVVTVGYYDTALELPGLDAATLVTVKGAGA